MATYKEKTSRILAGVFVIILLLVTYGLIPNEPYQDYTKVKSFITNP